MPIYEYRCTACGADFEKLHRTTESAPPCPQCGAAEVSRRMSLSSFHLKGSGWYSSDYKAASPSSSASASSGGAASETSAPSSDTASGHGCGAACACAAKSAQA